MQAIKAAARAIWAQVSRRVMDNGSVARLDWRKIGSHRDRRMPKLVANDIATVLKRRISAGEWLEHGRMPAERDLAQEFGVARNTVRRAVGLLERDGTVVRQVGRGTFVSAGGPDSIAAAIL